MSEALETHDNSCNYKKIYYDDPESQLKLIDKHVKVEMIKNCSFLGFLHSVDPLSHSIILSIPQGDVCQTTLIPGHAIVNITETPSSSNIQPPRRKPVSKETPANLVAKKSKLIAWFKCNLLPVTESENKIVLGNLSLLSPYNVSDICTDNPIIASQIKQLMEKMPEDFVPK